MDEEKSLLVAYSMFLCTVEGEAHNSATWSLSLFSHSIDILYYSATLSGLLW